MQPTCTRAATEELDAETRADIVRLCVAAHDEPDFERLFTYIPSGGRHFLARRGVQLVSHAVVTTRWLRLDDGRRLRTAFVDAVATLPALQGQGYGSAVLRLLAGSIDDYDVGCLQSDRPQFYERLGWEPLRGPLAGIDEHGLTLTPDQQGILVLRLPGTRGLDLDGPLTIEHDAARIW